MKMKTTAVIVPFFLFLSQLDTPSAVKEVEMIEKKEKLCFLRV